jgi:hypothetical protein
MMDAACLPWKHQWQSGNRLAFMPVMASAAFAV